MLTVKTFKLMFHTHQAEAKKSCWNFPQENVTVIYVGLLLDIIENAVAVCWLKTMNNHAVIPKATETLDHPLLFSLSTILIIQTIVSDRAKRGQHSNIAVLRSRLWFKSNYSLTVHSWFIQPQWHWLSIGLKESLCCHHQKERAYR